jgi:hypothetical protein
VITSAPYSTGEEEVSSTEPVWDQALNTWTTTDSTGNTSYWYDTTTTTSPRWIPQIRGAQEDPPSEDADTEDSDSDESADDTGDDKPDEEERKFTQEDVNKLLAKEVDKAKRGKLDPKELGFDSRKDLETFIKSMKEKSEEEKTEAEKERETAIAAAKDEATKGVMAQSKKLVLKAEFKLMAQEHGVSVEARDDAFVIAQTLADWEHVEVSDEGEVTGLDTDFFETLKKDKPYLFAQPADEEETTPGNIGQRASGAKKDASDERTLKEKYPALQGPGWRW